MHIAARDIILLFATRTIRLFAYGFISVVLALYLAATGLGATGVGAVLTATLAGDILVSLWVTMVADRFGRRNMLLLGATLMILSGLVFLSTTNPVWITLAAIIGIVSPSGGEIGPFLSIEQAALAQLVPDNRRTRLFGWYNLAGSFATAAGALAGVRVPAAQIHRCHTQPQLHTDHLRHSSQRTPKLAARIDGAVARRVDARVGAFDHAERIQRLQASLVQP